MNNPLLFFLTFLYIACVSIFLCFDVYFADFYYVIGVAYQLAGTDICTKVCFLFLTMALLYRKLLEFAMVDGFSIDIINWGLYEGIILATALDSTSVFRTASRYNTFIYSCVVNYMIYVHVLVTQLVNLSYRQGHVTTSLHHN